MKELKNKALAGLKQGADALGQFADLVSEHWENLTEFRRGSGETDRMHYCLIPLRVAEHGYVLHTVHELPAGVPKVNDLPKERLFHVPSRSAMPLLEAVFIEQNLENAAPPEESTSASAETLEKLADRIDYTNSQVSRGLVLVGGITALVNPIVGVALMGSALIPSMGGGALSESLKQAGARIRTRARKSEKENRVEEVRSTLKRLKPRLLENPLLARLDRALDTAYSEFDPMRDDMENNEYDVLDDRLVSDSGRAVIVQAITAIYRPLLNQTQLHAEASLGPEDLAWLRQLCDEDCRRPGH